MGQFTEQIQQINAVQNEILTERKRKQQEKERKQLLDYFFNKYKAKIIIEEETITDEKAIEIFSQFDKTLKNNNFDKTTRILKEKQLEEFYKKTIKPYQKETNKEKELKNNIYFLIERSYSNYNYKAYNKLDNCKKEIILYYKGIQANYQDIQFFDKINKQFSKQYPAPKKTNYLSAIVLGLIFGTCRGYKQATKTNKKARF